jgi:hypothetical protein
LYRATIVSKDPWLWPGVFVAPAKRASHVEQARRCASLDRAKMVIYEAKIICSKLSLPFGVKLMAKPHRNLKKANHGARPANSKARKMKRKHIRT